MKKLNKISFSLGLSALMLMSSVIPVSASTVTFVHGNNNSNNYCYARTKQTSDDYVLGAKITWQLEGSNVVRSGSTNFSSGYSAISKSTNLDGKKGKSFGYYYINGKLSHKSTAWMNFSF